MEKKIIESDTPTPKKTRLEELEEQFVASQQAHAEAFKRLQMMQQQEQLLAKQCYELQIRIDEQRQINTTKK